MGKHKSDKYSQALMNRHGRAGIAPQVPLMKAQQRGGSKRGK